MPISEYVCVFAHTPREHLGVTARFIAAIPGLIAGTEGELDLHHSLTTGNTAAVIRAASEVFTPEALARLRFWSARAGARVASLGASSEADGAQLRAEVEACERAIKGVPLRQAQDAAERFFRTAGVMSSIHPTGARTVLAIDLDGPGAKGLTYSPSTRTLFMAGALAPPLGDQLVLSVRHGGAAASVDGWATVVEVRGPGDAGPGRPAGFSLRVEEPPQLHDLLARHARGPGGHDSRAAPRFPVTAPVKVTLAATTAHASPAAPRALVEYATDQELAIAWIENLSQGGAFVRTDSPHPEGTELVFELALPDAVHLEGTAVVAFVNRAGMGLRFTLSPQQDALLAAAIARTSGRPKRALVVDDDELSRRLLSDALSAQGFDVLTAPDASSGLTMLIDELLALDLFVTDLVMPGLGGEALIRMIREAGGEAELAIVAVSGRLDAGVESVLQAAGADAVLDKAIGPEGIAQAADAAMSRKRREQRMDAAQAPRPAASDAPRGTCPRVTTARRG